MATAGGQIEVGTVRRYLHRNDDNSCWFGRWNYSLRWIQSSGCKTDKIVPKWKPMQLTLDLLNDPHNYEFKRKK
jgi:hypothetical protein